MRKNYIDNLRCSVMLLVIVYHVFYMFNSVGVLGNVSVKGIPQFDIVLYILYPWFMAFLFLLAGMSAKYSLNTRTNKEFLKERVKKVLVPSIASMFLIGWIGGYVTNQYSDMFMGAGDTMPGIAKYLIYCACGIGPVWFLHELFAASLLIVLLRVIDKKGKLWELGKKTNLVVLLLLYPLIWGSSNILNIPVVEVYRNGIYLFMFLIGYYIFSHDEVQNLVEKYKWISLVVAVVSGFIYIYTYWGQNYANTANLTGPLVNLYVWSMSLALLGCGKAWFNRETRFTRYMRPRNFGFYILHYTIMVGVVFILDKNFELPTIVFYIIVLILEALLLPVTWEIISRIPIIRSLLLGIYKKKEKNV